MNKFEELRRSCEYAWGMSLEESLMQPDSIEYHYLNPMPKKLVEGLPYACSGIERWYKCIQKLGYVPNEYVEL